MPTIDLGSVVGPQGQQGNTGPAGPQGVAGPSLISASTQTTLAGVLAGDGSTVGVRAVDATPTNNSTNLVSSGGVYTKITNDVANAYQRTCNPNLLDNWYFVGGGSQQGGGQFPINQRGQTSYSHSSTAYGIDRWQDSRIAVTVDSDGLSIAQNTSGYTTGYTKQFIETRLAGKTVTISALLSSGDLIVKTGTLAVGTMLESDEVNGCKIGLRQSTASSNTEFFFWTYAGMNVAKKVVAVKAELGSTQTLCHNEGTDANPTWVLNEIPNYAEELYKCYRYFVRIGHIAESNNRFGLANAYSSNVAVAVLALPTTMYSGVTPTVSGYENIKLQTGSTVINSTNVTLSGLTTNAVVLDITTAANQLTAGGCYIVRGDAVNNVFGHIDISAEI